MSAARGRSVGAPPLRPGGCRTNAENCAENPIADRLLIQLEQLRDLLDGQEFIWHTLNLTESNGRSLSSIRLA